MPALGTGVVIGAGFAGLGAARVLSEHCERVVVLDRDELTSGDAPRRCVPQGRHVHLLLASGFRSLCQLFAGFEAQAVESGAVRFQVGRELQYWRRGRQKQAFDADLWTLAVSRPRLEALVRRRLAALPNVQLHGHHTVTGLRSLQGRVTGVEVEGHARWDADLVVDTGGRGSHARRWLGELGFPTPRASTLDLELAYASRVVRLPADAQRSWQMLYVGPSAARHGPGRSRSRCTSRAATKPAHDRGLTAPAAPGSAGPSARAGVALRRQRLARLSDSSNTAPPAPAMLWA